MQIQQRQVQYTVDAVLSVVVSAFFDNPSLFVSDVRISVEGGGGASFFKAVISLSV